MEVDFIDFIVGYSLTVGVLHIQLFKLALAVQKPCAYDQRNQLHKDS